MSKNGIFLTRILTSSNTFSGFVFYLHNFCADFCCFQAYFRPFIWAFFSIICKPIIAVEHLHKIFLKNIQKLLFGYFTDIFSFFNISPLLSVKITSISSSLKTYPQPAKYTGFFFFIVLPITTGQTLPLLFQLLFSG